MKISEVKNGQGSINVEGDVVDVSGIREINKFGKNLKVATAVLQDDSGKIKLTLWNEETSKVHVGDRVKITNGYAKAFQDDLQLTAGKFGKIEVVGKATGGYESGSAPEVDQAAENKSKTEKVDAIKTNVQDDEEDDKDDASDDEEW